MADRGISIGKYFGIEVDLHWTFVLLLILAFVLDAYFFLIIVFLFICVLLHEFAHSLTALKNRISVKRILLLPIGGASIIDDTKISPEVEFNIALAGPLASIFLGFAFGVLAVITPIGILTQTMQYMFELNIFMGIFNIIPAFPMDGGRIFRSYLERRYDFAKATKITLKISKALIAAFAVITIIFVLFANSFSLGYREFVGFWNILIIVILYSGAEGEEESARIRELTKGMSVGTYASNNYIFTKHTISFSDLKKEFLKTKKHIIVMQINGKYYVADVLSYNTRYVPSSLKGMAVELMMLDANTNVATALGKMQASNSWVAAVMSNGKMKGIVTTGILQAAISIALMQKRHSEEKEL